MLSIDSIINRLLFKSDTKIKPKAKSILSETAFSQNTRSKLVVHSEIPAKYSDGICFLTSPTSDYSSIFNMDKVNTSIKDIDGRCIGNYKYNVDFPKNEINNGYIETLNGYRHKGIGELMRLSSIIELNENNLDAIKIEALSPAVPFHLHYKFQPEITDKDCAYKVLCEIGSNNNVAEKYRKEADLLRKALPQNTNEGFELSKSNAKKINQFIKEFVKAHISNWDAAKFDYEELPMTLTKETIKENAGFFNGLFEKHGIDYEI